jgi:hypothetical protein
LSSFLRIKFSKNSIYTTFHQYVRWLVGDTNMSAQIANDSKTEKQKPEEIRRDIVAAM